MKMERFCLKQINNIEGQAPIVICLNSDLLEIGNGTFPSLKKIRYLRPQHARVTKRNNDWFIKNLARYVGTYVNSRRITKKQKLKIGDIIGFGVSNLTSKGLVCRFCLTNNEIMNEPVYIVNEENPQRCYDLSTIDNSASNSVDLSNELSILKPSSAKVGDNGLENIKKCFVKLIKCDSKLPPDIKSISEPHKMAFSNSSQRRYAEQHKGTVFGANASLLPQVNNELHVDDKSNVPCDSFQIDSSYVQRRSSHSHSHCKPQSSVTAVVKPLRKTQDRNNQGDENHVGYSQTEEVICISDDDSHLDFNSSLPIKPDVLYDSDYLDISLLDELPDENDIQLIYDTNDDKETIENINNFNFSFENIHVKKEKGEHSYSDLDCPTDIFSADKSDKEFLSGNVSDNLNHTLPSVNSLTYNKYALSDEKIKSNIVFDNARENNTAIDSISDYESGDSDVSLHSIIMYPSSCNKSSEKTEAKDSEKPKYLINSDDDENGAQESEDSDISLHSIFVYPSPHKKSSEKTDLKHSEKPKYVIKSHVDENVSVKKSKLVSRTMLTEPKPMIPRPKRSRGREEVFIPVDDEEPVEIRRGTEPAKKHMTDNSPVKSFQKKCESKSSNLNEIRKEKLRAIEVGEAKNLKNLSSNSVAKHTLPTVKIRPEHFSSRSQFLTTSFIKNDTLETRSSIKRISESNVKTGASKKAKQTNSDLPVDNFSAKKSVQSQDTKNSFSFNNDLIPDAISITSGVEGNSNGLNRKLSKNSNQPSTSKDNSDKKSKDNKTKKFFNNNTSLASDSSISIYSQQSLTSKDKEISDKKSKDRQTKTCFKDNTSFVSDLNTSINRDNKLSDNNLSSNFNTSTEETRTVLHSINTDSRLNKDISNQVIDTSTQFKQVNDFSYNKEDKKPTAVVAGTSYPNSQTYSANRIIEKIVGLNVQWINEQKRNKLPPPFVYKVSGDLPLSFDSYEHYVSVFQPMLMLEIWEEICKFARPVLDSDFKCQKFYFTIYKSQKKNSLIIYDCESLINQNSPEPTEGNLVILAIKTLDGKVHVIFGYISKHQVITNFLSKHISPKWDQVTSNWISGAKLYKFSVVTKLNLLPKCYDIMRGNVILSVKKKFHLALALEKFKAHPLRDNILKPDHSAFTVSNHITSHCYEMRFSASQTQVIDSLGEELERENQEKKIFLLQGPPGTGKTRTIIGLLERLIFSPNYSGKKILITAPSNVAVDEIGMRIVDFNERLSYKRVEIKFVRIGQGKDMNVKMKDYSLEIQADDAVRNNPVKDGIGQSTVQSTLYHKKIQILKRCHVILSTLRNCWHPAICSKDIQIAACIVDEATQCTEIEILQPLTLNIHKLLLIGDYNQLPPTVLSQIAIQKHFDRSMLERIDLYLSKTVSPNPPYMLKEQFRMHSDICEFPSRYFYGGQLITEFGKNQDFSISPYVVFDVLNCNDDNCDEVVAVAKLCEFVSTKESYSTIGVIVPHREQIDLFQNFLSKIRGHKNIEVNIVDNFQGREKDIIIISCLSPNYLAESIDFLSSKRRLNVAITRARHSLLVVVNSSMLCYYDHWDALFSDAKRRNLFVKINEPKNITNMFDFLHVRH